MRERELRLALICYGGVSLAVYMHGITREIWHLAKASEAFHAGRPPESGSEGIYARLLAMAAESGLSVRVLVDILAGASAGGINAIFLGDAIASGSTLEPLTDLWLDGADVDRLIDPEVSAFSRFAKSAALPFAWAWSRRRGSESGSEDPAHRSELKAKVASFVRGRWFAPPFGGARFTGVLLDALDAMKAGPAGPRLLPPGHPIDLSVTVTDFHGFPETLRLNSPAEVLETEHRLTLSFRSAGGDQRLAETAELAFAARATASFPGAFPPFTVAELDSVLASRGESWPGRAAFLRRVFPRHRPDEAERAVLIDGSILANAPFRPAIAALQNRPARREVDRRFVYIDPKPGIRSVRLSSAGEAEAPGFLATILGALSDIPREQPIRDNLEAIEGRSARIRRLGKIVEAIRPEVEAAIGKAFGNAFFLRGPSPQRLKAWRGKAHLLAAREAGFAYAAYGQLKLSRVVEDVVAQICRLAGAEAETSVREEVWEALRTEGIAADDAFTAKGTSDEAIRFLARFDLAFRIRRLRFLARQLQAQSEERPKLRSLLDALIGRYRSAAALPAGAAGGFADAAGALADLASRLDLGAIDDEADARLSEALAKLPRGDRNALIVAYLGFPFYDIATFPLLQEDGRDEFDPIKVDRISPDDAVAIRSGGTAATLKGIQFNSFGAFFSRAYRENDYLWGRLHGADRLVDILVSAMSEPPGGAAVAALKRDAFRAILAEEKGRLTNISGLFEELEREIG
jgi:patatin-related protein